MEEVVKTMMDEVMEKQDMCTCKRCQLDVTALALNELPPRYVVSSKGEAFSRADFLKMQKNIDVLREINQAVLIVKDRPRHHAKGNSS